MPDKKIKLTRPEGVDAREAAETLLTQTEIAQRMQEDVRQKALAEKARKVAGDGTSATEELTPTQQQLKDVAEDMVGNKDAIEKSIQESARLTEEQRKAMLEQYKSAGKVAVELGQIFQTPGGFVKGLAKFLNESSDNKGSYDGIAVLGEALDMFLTFLPKLAEFGIVEKAKYTFTPEQVTELRNVIKLTRGEKPEPAQAKPEPAAKEKNRENETPGTIGSERGDGQGATGNQLGANSIEYGR